MDPSSPSPAAPEGRATLSQEQLLEALKGVYDPEIPFNIVDLGLIYELRLSEGEVYVKMTLTAPGCPLHATIASQVKRALEKVEGVKGATVEIVWQPPWTPERLSPQARHKLGIK